MVYIKRVTTDDSEVRIATYLSQDLFRQDPHNHSVPILDLFRDDYDQAGVSYMVMPFLSLANVGTVGEVVDFCDQVLEVGSFYVCPTKPNVNTISLYVLIGPGFHARSWRRTPVRRLTANIHIH